MPVPMDRRTIRQRARSICRIRMLMWDPYRRLNHHPFLRLIYNVVKPPWPRRQQRRSGFPVSVAFSAALGPLNWPRSNKPPRLRLFVQAHSSRHRLQAATAVSPRYRGWIALVEFPLPPPATTLLSSSGVLPLRLVRSKVALVYRSNAKSGRGT
jgi:hypothetical protein